MIEKIKEKTKEEIKEIAKITATQEAEGFKLEIQFYDKQFAEFIENLASQGGMNQADYSNLGLLGIFEIFPQNALFEKVVSACTKKYSNIEINPSVLRLKQKNNTILFETKSAYFTYDEIASIVYDLKETLQLLYKVFKKKETIQEIVEEKN